MGITRAEAPVWASKVLVEKAVLDRLLAPLGTIPLDWGECGFVINVYMAFMMVWLGVVARSSMARGSMVILVICLGMALRFGYPFSTITFCYLVLMYDKISLILLLL